MLIAIAVLVFLGATFAAITFVLEAQSKQMSSRFTQVVTHERDDPSDAVRGSFRERVIGPMIDRVNAIAVKLAPRDSVKATELRLERAGHPWGLNASTWSVMRIGSGVATVMGALALVKVLPVPENMRMVATLVLGATGYILPSYLLDMTIKGRQAKVKHALPDVIDLLVVSVEAGLGLDASVQEVLKRRTGPLIDEFARVLQEVRVGKTRRTAWQELAERVDLLELKVFVAALVQAEELGASIAGVLSGQAESLRVRRSLSVREVAAMLPVKMLFPLIFFIFPSVFVVILGPGMITLVTTFKEIGF